VMSRTCVLDMEHEGVTYPDGDKLITKGDQVMIDIETLSSASNAAIVSIGACMFSLEEDAEYAAPEDSFIVGVDTAFYGTVSVPWAFDISQRTMEWWAEQSQEAKDSLVINQVPTVGAAIRQLETWLYVQGFLKDPNPFGPDASRIWAFPPSFDLVILRNAAKHVYGSTNEVPWHYRQETCARTHAWIFEDLSKKAYQGRKTNGLLSGLTKHRADHDAVRQARVVQFIERERRNGQEDRQEQAVTPKSATA